MKKRANKRAQIKRVKFLMRLALLINQHLLPLVKELVSIPGKSYKLIPLDPNIKYQDPANIPESDPRYLIYKLRSIFGPD